MPAAMEGWRSSGGSSKEEQESVGTLTGGGDATGKGGSELAAVLAPALAMGITAGSKRQRRPSVRLGEIGDLKAAASKSESLSTVRWITPDFMTKKSSRGPGKLPRTRPLANVSHRGDIGQVLGSPMAAAKDQGPPLAPATEAIDREEMEDAPADAVNSPSTSGRGVFGAPVPAPTYGRKGRHGRRRRAAGGRPRPRPGGIAKSLGAAAALNRKARERHKVGYITDLAPPPPPPIADDEPAEFAELSGTQAAADEDMEEDSGAARDDDENMGGNDEEKNDNHNDAGNNNNSDAAAWDVEEEYEEQTQNGDTEVLDEDDGEDSSGRQEEDEPGTASPGVRDNNHVMNDDANGILEAAAAAAAAAAAPAPPHGFSSAKGDLRDHSTSRVADGEKDHHGHSMPLVREASMNGRRGEAPVLPASLDGGVRGWLGSLGLDRYGDVFEENEVDDDVLHLLTFEDLKEMGVMAVGARRKIFSAIQELGATSASGR